MANRRSAWPANARAPTQAAPVERVRSEPLPPEPAPQPALAPDPPAPQPAAPAEPAAPLLTHAIRIDLPHASSRASDEEAQAVTVSVNALSEVFWDIARVTSAQLLERVTRAARSAPQPELRLRVDREVRYQLVAELLAGARDAGLTRLSFVTDPRAAPQPVQPSASGPLQPGQALPDPSPGS